MGADVEMAVLWDLVENAADAEPEFIFRIYSATKSPICKSLG